MTHTTSKLQSVKLTKMFNGFNILTSADERMLMRPWFHKLNEVQLLCKRGDPIAVTLVHEGVRHFFTTDVLYTEANTGMAFNSDGIGDIRISYVDVNTRVNVTKVISAKELYELVDGTIGNAEEQTAREHNDTEYEDPVKESLTSKLVNTSKYEDGLFVIDKYVYIDIVTSSEKESFKMSAEEYLKLLREAMKADGDI